MAIEHLLQTEIYHSTNVRDNLQIPGFVLKNLEDDLNLIRTLIKRILGTSSYTDVFNIEDLRSLYLWRTTHFTATGHIKATSIDYSVVTDVENYPAVLQINTIWVKLKNFSNYLDGSNKLTWAGTSFTIDDINTAILSTPTITNIYNQIAALQNNFNTLQTSVNASISSLTSQYNALQGTVNTINQELYGNPDSRPNVLRRLNYLEEAISNLSSGGDLTTLQNQVSQLQQRVSDLQSQFFTLSSTIEKKPVDYFYRKQFFFKNVEPDEKSGLLFTTDLGILNTTFDVSQFTSILLNAKTFGLHRLFIPVSLKTFAQNVTTIADNLKAFYNYIHSSSYANNSFPRIVLLVVFDKSLNEPATDAMLFLQQLKSFVNSTKNYVDLAFQIKDPIMLLNDNDNPTTYTIPISNYKQYLLEAFENYLETNDKLIVFTYQPEVLFNLFRELKLERKVIVYTSPRFYWKKQIMSVSVDVELLILFNIYYFDDIIDLSICSTSPTISVCKLFDNSVYSDFATYLNLSTDINGTFLHQQKVRNVLSLIGNRISIWSIGNNNLDSYGLYYDSTDLTFYDSTSIKNIYTKIPGKLSWYIADSSFTSQNSFLQYELANTNEYLYKTQKLDPTYQYGTIFVGGLNDSFILIMPVEINNSTFTFKTNGLAGIDSTYSELFKIEIFNGTLTIKKGTTTLFTATFNNGNFVLFRIGFNFSSGSMSVTFDFNGTTTTQTFTLPKFNGTMKINAQFTGTTEMHVGQVLI